MKMSMVEILSGHGAGKGAGYPSGGRSRDAAEGMLA